MSDGSNGEASATTPASRGTASAVGGMAVAGTLDAASGTAETGSSAGVSRGTVAGGGGGGGGGGGAAAASVFLEKSHMLRAARGACTRVVPHGNERLTR